MARLVVVLGDQLDPQSRAFDGFDARLDRVWMAEVAAESTHVPSHKARTALFLAAMRHFRDELRARGITVEYRELGQHAAGTLGEALAADLRRLQPERVVMVPAGEYRVAAEIEAAVTDAGLALERAPDDHFLITPEAFAGWAHGRKELRLEYFYRWMRRRTGILMDGDRPAGGRWNFDAENRGAFGAAGPGWLPSPAAFPPDAITRTVMDVVERELPGNPGRLDAFDWPVTRAQALTALDDFVTNRLALFGRWQDAMWRGEPWLYHSRIAAALNLKLLSPRETCDAAERAWRDGRAPLDAVEGFVRQVLGWREYVRGIYWREMPSYVGRNALGATHALPTFFWTGETDLACLRETIGQTLALGYAHHIQRLMVTGLFALLWGVRPAEVHQWYLSVYVDAVEWVELPNTLGMSQYGDGGLLASKPYVATGKYIARMSNYCAGCRYRPDRAHGDDACPYTTLYWDFLARHRERFARHPRLALQVRNLDRLSSDERGAIAARAAELRRTLDAR
ncbi:MAG: cryptochrome/photolyase family protein [Steroidobacteraceae bacterium]|nr:cryptochrome/photolyase family protein [Steroidobacteraceae bacterium]